MHGKKFIHAKASITSSGKSELSTQRLCDLSDTLPPCVSDTNDNSSLWGYQLQLSDTTVWHIVITHMPRMAAP